MNPILRTISQLYNSCLFSDVVSKFDFCLAATRNHVIPIFVIANSAYNNITNLHYISKLGIPRFNCFEWASCNTIALVYPIV